MLVNYRSFFSFIRHKTAISCGVCILPYYSGIGLPLRQDNELNVLPDSQFSYSIVIFEPYFLSASLKASVITLIFPPSLRKLRQALIFGSMLPLAK